MKTLTTTLLSILFLCLSAIPAHSQSQHENRWTKYNVQDFLETYFIRHADGSYTKKDNRPLVLVATKANGGTVFMGLAKPVNDFFKFFNITSADYAFISDDFDNLLKLKAVVPDYEGRHYPFIAGWDKDKRFLGHSIGSVKNQFTMKNPAEGFRRHNITTKSDYAAKCFEILWNATGIY